MSTYSEINKHPTPEMPAPLHQTVITDEAIIGLPLDAENIGTITDREGNERPVQAYLSMPKIEEDGTIQNERFALSADGEKGIKWFKVEGDKATAQGKVPASYWGETMHDLKMWDSKNDYDRDASVYDLQVGFAAPTYGQEKGMVLLSKYTKPASDVPAPEVTLESATVPKTFSEPKQADIWQPNYATLPKSAQAQNKLHVAENEARAKSHRLGRKVLVALGAYAAIKSGGVVDKGGETFQDAGQTVHSALATPRKYHSGEHNVTTPEQHKAYDSSVDRVAQTMEDWDKKDMGAIHERAEAFKRQFANELMPEQKISEFKQRLAEVKSNEEIRDVLNDFLKFYDKKAEFLSKDFNVTDHDKIGAFDPATGNTDQLRSFAKSAVDTLSYLPSGLIKSADFKTIKMGGEGSAHAHTSNAIYYSTEQFGMEGIKGVLSNVEFAGEQMSAPDRMILHEIGHSLAEDGYGQSSGDVGGIGNTAKYIGGRLIQMPEQQSFYAAISEDYAESEAENFSAAFSMPQPNTLDETNLADPDHWRRFTSGANKASLAVIRRFEEKYPGITDYVVEKVNLRTLQNKAPTTIPDDVLKRALTK